MTRNCDVWDLEDLMGCQHEPETPIVEEDGTEILYWLCRCGRRVKPREKAQEQK